MSLRLALGRERLERTRQLVQGSPYSRLTLLRRFLRPMRRDYRRRLGMSLRTWLLHHQLEILFDKPHWMGVRALKNPLDAWVYQEIIYETKPQAIIEIGSAEGGSTLFFAHMLDLLGDGIVVSIDIDRSGWAIAGRHPRIVELTGDSASDEIVDRARELCRDKRVLVIHDGDHRREQVRLDLERYAPLVTPGSYLIVEDGIIDLYRPGDGIAGFDPGPLSATQEFLRGAPEFTVDKDRERYLITANPDGFLRRSSAG